MNNALLKKIDFLPLFTVSFCLGICLENWWHVPFLFLYVSAVIFAVLSLLTLKKEHSDLLLLVLGFILGALLFRNVQTLPGNHVAKYTSHKSRDVFIEGVVAEEPSNFGGNIKFVLEAQRIKTGRSWQEVCGKVWVRANTDEKISYRDTLLLEGKLYKPFRLKMGQRLNYRDYLKYKGIYSLLSVNRNSVIKRMQTQRAKPLVYYIYNLKTSLRQAVNKNLSFVTASIINAILLGERQSLPQDITDTLVNTGTVHIISISGLHLVIVGFIIFMLLKLARLSPRIRYCATIIILIFYCILTGAKVPVVRSTFMSAVLLIGYILRRQTNIYNSLSVAAIIILILNPWQIFDISFQLSFMSIVSIVWLSPMTLALVPKRLLCVRYLRSILNLLSVSLAAWLGLIPLIAYYFKIITPVAVLANLAIVPLTTLLTAAGFTFLLASIIAPFLVSLFSHALEGLVFVLLMASNLFAHLPFAYFRLKDFLYYEIFIYYGSLFLIFYLLGVFKDRIIAVK